MSELAREISHQLAYLAETRSAYEQQNISMKKLKKKARLTSDDMLKVIKQFQDDYNAYLTSVVRVERAKLDARSQQSIADQCLTRAYQINLLLSKSDKDKTERLEALIYAKKHFIYSIIATLDLSKALIAVRIEEKEQLCTKNSENYIKEAQELIDVIFTKNKSVNFNLFHSVMYNTDVSKEVFDEESMSLENLYAISRLTRDSIK